MSIKFDRVLIAKADGALVRINIFRRKATTRKMIVTFTKNKMMGKSLIEKETRKKTRKVAVRKTILGNTIMTTLSLKQI